VADLNPRSHDLPLSRLQRGFQIINDFARVKSAWFGHGEAVKRRLLARLLQFHGAAVG
jgi:hypothetical protein